jgi:hypothetical protein
MNVALSALALQQTKATQQTAKDAAKFLNYCASHMDATIQYHSSDKMGHPQPATLIQTYNSTACGIANDTNKQQQPRAINMRFYWVQDRVQQGQFHIYWGLGKLNLANYYTKHHAATHHQVMRSKYLYIGKHNAANASILDSIAQAMHALRGCVKAPAPASPMCASKGKHSSGTHMPASFSRSTALTQN